MADLRDFTPSRDDSAPRYIDEPVSFSAPVRDDAVIIDDGGLDDFHVNHEAEEKSSNRSKLFAGLAVAVLVGIGGAYTYSQYAAEQPVVADNRLPAPSAVTKTPAMTPPAPMPAAADQATAATAATAPDAAKSAPVTRQAAITSAPKVTSSASANDADKTVLPAEQTAQLPSPAASPDNQAANVAEPVSPTPPASSVAGNPAMNQQSADQTQADQAPSQDAAPAQPEAAGPAQPDAAAAQPTPAPVEPAPANPAQ